MLPKDLYEENYEAIMQHFTLSKRHKKEKFKMLFVDHQTTAKLQKREQNMPVLLKNNIPVLLAKSF
ncbi:UNVERIFIED_CONTAM: hypothetical protein NCL1_18823 [Trichonephila clavipes]